MPKKCNFCNKTTNKSLCDFADIGWEAYSLNNEKAICSCPEHTNELKENYTNRLKR